jgi:hypothetical protein
VLAAIIQYIQVTTTLRVVKGISERRELPIFNYICSRELENDGFFVVKRDLHA